MFYRSLFVLMYFFFWWGKDRFTTSGTYLVSFVTQMLHNGQPSHDFRSEDFNLTKRNPWFSCFLVISKILWNWYHHGSSFWLTTYLLSFGGRVFQRGFSRKTKRSWADLWAWNKWYHVTQMLHNGQPSHDFRSDDFNLTKRNPWFSSFLVSSNPLSRKSWY
jgi:hypothetical protein